MEFGNYIGARERSGAGGSVPVLDKYSQEIIAHVANSREADVDAAVASASAAFAQPLPLRERIEILRRAADGLHRLSDEFIRWTIAEGGQTRAEATREVGRAVGVLRLCAEEAERLSGEIVPLEGFANGAGKHAYTARHPLGVVCAITPFNSPVNTPVHKIGPALAAGNSVVCKPASATPVCSLLLCRVFEEAGLPPGWLNVITGSGNALGKALASDERIEFYHFTGSTEVGRQLAGTIGLRRSSLELGSIAATIICGDADLSTAVNQAARAAFAKAGQVCTSTQIVFAERQVFGDVCERLAELGSGMRAGDPRDPAVNVGPLISPTEAERIEAWVDSATASGARVLSARRRDGACVAPIVVSDPPASSELICREVFGPVVSVVPVDSAEEACARYNTSPYGLSVGVFTSDLRKAFMAARQLRAGVIHINASSSNRLDAMPFGGVKLSGHGKEGPKYAIREMSEERLVIFHHLDKPA